MGARLTVRCAWAAVLAATVAACSPTADPAPTAPVDLGEPAAFARALFDEANAEREDAGLPPLDWSDCLAAAALPRATAQLGTAPLSHAPLPSPCTPGATAGENLSRTSRSAPDVVDLWMASAAHKANLLSEAFAASGIACVAYSYDDPTAPAAPGEPVGGMVCSQLFEGETG